MDTGEIGEQNVSPIFPVFFSKTFMPQVHAVYEFGYKRKRARIGLDYTWPFYA